MAEEINIKSGKAADAAKKKSDISTYTKKTVLEFLQQNGCTHANLETVARARRGNTQKIIDFFCQSYANAEQDVNQDCNSVSLNNINHWLELLNKSELSNICEYESAAVLNAIRRNEPQPEPEQLEGIDMSEAYTFLENALTGQPQKKLSEATEKFMAREIELLIAEANTEESDSLARDIGQQLSTRQDYNYEAEPHRCSLDPLFLNDKEP
ncbi:uncharacterized protein LOC132788563 [Drosophila nasuta]|uniref:uncharacterized protein LOC132788563 n=1 Tax=Drosophila nasuta TaxID=42062 RepID=UPI00295F33D6|nr:uncharacterized protein LOC132788563 [Drosophila nasuta]